MAPLRVSFLIRSSYDLLLSNANLVRWGNRDDPTCPLCQGRQTTEHVLGSCREALAQGRYTWRHNRVLQELTNAICSAEGQPNLTTASTTVFTSEGGLRKWHGSSSYTTTHKRSILNGCSDWELSADLSYWGSYPESIKKTRMRPDIVFHSASSRQIIMIELTVPYECRMEKANVYK